MRSKPKAAASALTPAAPAVEPRSVEAELELLRDAQRAPDRSARTALALAEQQAQLYPQGTFVEEREMLRIEAELTRPVTDLCECPSGFACVDAIPALEPALAGSY